MTRNDGKSLLDQDFMKVYASGDRRVVSSLMPSTASQIGSTSGVNAVRVSLANDAVSVRASFDPVSAEENLRTKTLNQTARMGYKSAKVSTR